jgi:hypothetical protein
MSFAGTIAASFSGNCADAWKGERGGLVNKEQHAIRSERTATGPNSHDLFADPQVGAPRIDLRGGEIVKACSSRAQYASKRSWCSLIGDATEVSRQWPHD